uniref:Tetraspanin-18 isoform X2 n=1 Tax=Petromyzon marinus TaxID=7757 RepID=A0AAJ7WZL1_PETMA|nr:tetraspanin-18 isoform X2 [Petromyzon marinus]
MDGWWEEELKPGRHLVRVSAPLGLADVPSIAFWDWHGQVVWCLWVATERRRTPRFDFRALPMNTLPAIKSPLDWRPPIRVALVKPSRCFEPEPNAKRYDPGFPTGPGVAASIVSMEGTCLSCVKYLMVFFNALIFLAGLCLVTVGVWAVADPGGVAEVVSSHHPLLLRSVHVILAVGAVFLLLGLLGCCGALCESRRTLTFFFILLLIIFMVELVTAIVAFVFREQLNEDYFALELKMRYQGDNATDVFSRFWNSAMKTFGCCGVRGPSDFWEGTLFWQLSSGKIIPEACCKGDIHEESQATMDRLRCLLGDPRHRNEQGCYTKIMQSLHNYILTVGGVVIGLLLIQLLAMSFTLCLFRRMI